MDIECRELNYNIQIDILFTTVVRCYINPLKGRNNEKMNVFTYSHILF